MAGDATTAARRPNLTSHGGLAEIRNLLAERTPLYESCADLTIDTENKSPIEIARRIGIWVSARPRGKAAAILWQDCREVPVRRNVERLVDELLVVIG